MAADRRRRCIVSNKRVREEAGQDRKLIGTGVKKGSSSAQRLGLPLSPVRIGCGSQQVGGENCIHRIALDVAQVHVQHAMVRERLKPVGARAIHLGPIAFASDS